MLLVPWIILIVIVLAAVLHSLLAARPLPPGRLLEIAVVHAIFWGVGVMSLFAAYALEAEPLATTFALRLGWPPGNPFQSVAAGRALAIGLAGVGVVWFRGGWLVAVTVAATIFGWGETILLIVSGVPAAFISTAVVYNLIGSLLLVMLLIFYRWRAGSSRFWRSKLEMREDW